MSELEPDALAMVAAMAPELEPGQFAFCTLSDEDRGSLSGSAIGTFREREGWSAILPFQAARELGLPCQQPLRMIRLGVNSTLDAVGLTAAVSTALTEIGVACNVVAARYHDYLFVPAADAYRALQRLELLSANARASR